MLVKVLRPDTSPGVAALRTNDRLLRRIPDQSIVNHRQLAPISDKKLA